MSNIGVGFRLALLEEGKRRSLYTIRFDGSSKTEFEKWVDNPAINSHKEFQEMYAIILSLPDEDIPPDYFFKQESYERHGYVCPLRKRGYAELRIYCMRPDHREWVVLGNGCVKDQGGSLHNTDACGTAFDEIEYVDDVVWDRISTDRAPFLDSYTDCLHGNFDFDDKPLY